MYCACRLRMRKVNPLRKQLFVCLFVCLFVFCHFQTEEGQTCSVKRFFFFIFSFKF